MVVMRVTTVICLIGFCCGLQRELADPDGDYAYLDWLDKVTRLALRAERSPGLKQLYEDRIIEAKTAERNLPKVDYDCPSQSLSVAQPTSVHELRPGDIDVVAAFGDSITACNGCDADNLVELAIENRGESWTIGGSKSLEEGFVTIPNILRQFHNEPRGYSSCASTRDMKLAWMNVAQPGAKCIHMPGQADRLIKKLKEDERIDFENDWKLVSLFIGGNDLCVYCGNEDQFSPIAYREKIEEALDKLHAEVPRVFVNLITMFDITPMKNMTRNILCGIMQMSFCECGLNETYRETLRSVQRGYYTELSDLVSSGKYDSRDDFTVVLQPHMTELKPFWDQEKNEWDTSYLSVDCFHPNRKGHRGLAYMLWNTMLFPVGQKPLEYPMPDDIGKMELCCPSEEYPYLFTNQNSVGVPIHSLGAGQQCWEMTLNIPARGDFSYPVDLVQQPKPRIGEGEDDGAGGGGRELNVPALVTMGVIGMCCVLAVLVTLIFPRILKAGSSLKMKILHRKSDENPIVSDDMSDIEPKIYM